MPPTYPPPVDRLLTFRETKYGEPWPDYPADFGLGPEHVPDLTRMIGEAALYESGDGPTYCATVHARRALGQLKAAGAVGPLLDAMDEFGDLDDYWTEELPSAFGLMGPEAIAPLVRGLGNRDHLEYSRIVAARGLEHVARADSEARSKCIGALTAQLATEEDDENAWALNGFIVSSLVNLNAVESAPVIEQAFARNVVDESIAGGWASQRFRLGLGPEPKGHDIRPEWRIAIPALDSAKRPNLDKLRKQRKTQKTARRKNRKGR